MSETYQDQAPRYTRGGVEKLLQLPGVKANFRKAITRQMDKHLFMAPHDWAWFYHQVERIANEQHAAHIQRQEQKRQAAQEKLGLFTR